MHSDAEDEFFNNEESGIIDHDDIPDLLHKWLEHESEDLNARLINEELDKTIYDVLAFHEAMFLVLYLCDMYNIDAKLTFGDGESITLISGEDGAECE